MEKKNTGIIVLVVVLIILVLGLGGFIVYDKVINNNVTETKKDADISSEKNETEEEKNDVLNNQDEIKELFSWSNPNFVIPDSEIKELYDYVKVGEGEVIDVCLKNYYQNPFNKNDIEELTAIVLSFYGDNKREKINDQVLSNVPASEREIIKNSAFYYVSTDIIITGLKNIFDINVTENSFSEGGYYGVYSYLESANIFIGLLGGSGYDAKQIEQIISYKKDSDQIEMVVAKAEISYDDNKVYRYINNESTFVTSSNGNFSITENNVDNFPQIKYIFKKNANNQYYVYDIVNLNYQNEYESCE